MAELNKNRVAMPEQPADKRITNFDEVALGYTAEMAVKEASRCLNCKNMPCVSGCPVNIRIPEFIKKIRENDIEGAYKIIKSTSSLPAVCGRVCPQENQCEARCVCGIKGESVAIGRLERYVADYMFDKETAEKAEPNGKKVAVIGGGPAGLTCAGDLNNLGYDVTIFEAFHAAGGVLSYGIPEFRLPKSVVRHEIKNLEKSGVKIMTNMVIGNVLTIDEIFDMDFEAVFIGNGAGLPNFMGIEGENLNSVFSANEFLTRINLMRAFDDNYDTPIYKFSSVAVIGGGNVAMDAARSARRLGAERVYIVYRRSEQEMPARKEEVLHAKEEGVEFLFLNNIKKINGDDSGNVSSITCVKMSLSEADESGRRAPVEIVGSEYDLNVDAVIMAIGNSPNKTVVSACEDIQTNRKDCIIVDEETLKTTLDGVYAGGDAVTGAATVILAMGAGKKAAQSIHEYLQNK